MKNMLEKKKTFNKTIHMPIGTNMSKNQPYGNIKLNGKKTKLLACGCCVAENRKEECKKKQDRKEIKKELGYARIGLGNR